MDQKIHEDVARMQVDVKHLDGCLDDLKIKLMGADGLGGVIGSVKADIADLRKENKEDVTALQSAHNKLIWILVAVAFVVFSSGSGTLSLKTLLEFFKAIP